MKVFGEKEISEAAGTGRMFSEARQAARFTLPKVSEITRIPERLLYHLEAEEYDMLPPDTFLRGIIARYSNALGLDASDMLSKYYASQKIRLTSGSRDRLPPNRFASARPLMVPFHAGYLAWTLAIGGFLYLAIEARAFVSPPRIHFENLLPDGFSVKSEILPLSGQIYGSRGVSINGERVGADKLGKFFYELKLKEGSNTVAVEAKNRFGKTAKVIRTITFQP